MTYLPSGIPHPGLTPPRRKTSEAKEPLVSALVLALRERRLIAVSTGLFLIVVVILALASPRTYTSTATFVPEGRKGAGAASGLAAQLGVAIDPTDASDSPAFYVDLLSSREILIAVLDSVHAPVNWSAQPVSLLSYYIRNHYDTTLQRALAVDSLRGAIVASTSRKTGVVHLAVSARDAALAKAIAERVIAEVSRFNLERRQSKASAERRFTGARLDEVRNDLRESEDRLQAFLQRNRGGSSPDLEFNKDRLTREVQLRQQLYSTLAQSFEQARIDEVRDTPVLTIIEHPVYPSKPESRQILRKSLLAVIAGFLIGFAIALLRDRFLSLEERDRNSQQEIAELWRMTKEDFSSVRGLFRVRRRVARTS